MLHRCAQLMWARLPRFSIAERFNSHTGPRERPLVPSAPFERVNARTSEILHLLRRCALGLKHERIPGPDPPRRP